MPGAGGKGHAYAGEPGAGDGDSSMRPGASRPDTQEPSRDREPSPGWNESLRADASAPIGQACRETLPQRDSARVIPSGYPQQLPIWQRQPQFGEAAAASRQASDDSRHAMPSTSDRVRTNVSLLCPEDISSTASKSKKVPKSASQGSMRSNSSKGTQKKTATGRSPPGPKRDDSLEEVPEEDTDFYTYPSTDELLGQRSKDRVYVSLRRMVMHDQLRLGLFLGLLALILLASAVNADVWFQRPTGTFEYPTAFTVYGLTHRRMITGGQVSYQDREDEDCSDDVDRFGQALRTTEVRRQVQQLIVERNLDPDYQAQIPTPGSENYNEVMRLRDLDCRMSTAINGAGASFASSLYVVWACLGLGLLSTMCWHSKSLISSRFAGMLYLVAFATQEFMWWQIFLYLQEEDNFALARLQFLGGRESNTQSVAVVAIARASVTIMSTRSLAFSSYLANWSAFAMLFGSLALLSTDLRRCCGPCFNLIRLFMQGISATLRPCCLKLEKNVVGVHDFDKKYETYVNKHENLGKEIKCCGIHRCWCLSRLLMTLRDLRRHQKRAFESMGMYHSLVSYREKETLLKHNVKDHVAQNFLAWRLSVLALTFTMGVVLLGFRFISMREATTSLSDVTQWAIPEIDATQMTFLNHTYVYIAKAFVLVDYKVTEGTLWLNLATTCAEIFAVIMCLLALMVWSVFGTSRKYLVWGWMILLFSPFVITAIPYGDVTGGLRGVDPILHEWVFASQERLQLTDKLLYCNMLQDNTHVVDPTGEEIADMCDKIDTYAFWVMFMTSIDISEAQKACNIWRQATGDDALKQVMIQLSRFCDAAVSGVNSITNSFATSLRFYLRMYISFRCSLAAYMTMVPAALAFGPGFVRAAWKLKLLFPFARLPGTLATLLPAMYCPLLWMTYHFVFQILNEHILLLAMFCISFAPMIYSGVGTVWDIKSPVLSRPRLARILRHGRFWRIWVQRFGYVLIIYWIISLELGFRSFLGEAGDSAEDTAFKQTMFVRFQANYKAWILNPLNPATFVISWSFKFFFTKAAGMDFLIEQIASDFAFDRCVEVVSKIPDSELKDGTELGLELSGTPERLSETRHLHREWKRSGMALAQMTLQEIGQLEISESTESQPEPDGVNKELSKDNALKHFAPELAQFAHLVAADKFMTNVNPRSGYGHIVEMEDWNSWNYQSGYGNNWDWHDTYGYGRSQQEAANNSGPSQDATVGRLLRVDEQGQAHSLQLGAGSEQAESTRTAQVRTAQALAGRGNWPPPDIV